MTLEVTIINNY